MEDKKPAGLFDIVGDVSHGKRGVFHQDVENQKAYVPYMINLAFSQHGDTVLWANMMNQYSFLSRTAQHDFYFHGLESKRRMGKWAKKAPDMEDLDLVKARFSVSDTKGVEILGLLSKADLDAIREELNEGGRKK